MPTWSATSKCFGVFQMLTLNVRINRAHGAETWLFPPPSHQNISLEHILDCRVCSLKILALVEQCRYTFFVKQSRYGLASTNIVKIDEFDKRPNFISSPNPFDFFSFLYAQLKQVQCFLLHSQTLKDTEQRLLNVSLFKNFKVWFVRGTLQVSQNLFEILKGRIHRCIIDALVY